MDSELFDRAVEFALNAHKGQVRKKENIPFILHPLEVATIIGTMTDDTDIMAAGLLHDTVEDTPVTIEEIEENFGKRIRVLVESETEDKRDDLPKEDTWKIRKIESLEDLKNTEDIGIKMLWLADKVSNMRSFKRLYNKLGNDLWLDFHQKDPKEQKWYYESVRDACSILEDQDAYKEYCDLVAYVFQEVE